MSSYTILDAAIVTAIRSQKSPLYEKDVATEAKRISDLTGRESFRVIDGRLQALRKDGLVAYSSKSRAIAGGWSLTPN